jgi:outer membrane lipopolysaccharide assembly protein LptE/RlpB
MRRGSLVLLVPLAIALASGCGYHLTGHSTSLPPTVKKIGIPIFVNKTDRPDLEQRITGFVISNFLTRGRYQIISSEEGVDAVLRGEITTFVQSPVSINAQGRATRYEILINARAALVQTSDDKVLWQDDHFLFRRQYDVSNQLEGSVAQEAVALDQVCSDFAESVVTSILEGF